MNFEAGLTTIPAICRFLLIATETQGQVINYFITILQLFLAPLFFSWQNILKRSLELGKKLLILL
jgi:hypothetical protein